MGAETMRVWIRVSLILFALTAHDCTQSSQAPGFSPGVVPKPRRSPPRITAPKQPSDEQLKTRLTQLLKQLASDKYKDREKATSELKKLMKEIPEIMELLKTEFEQTKDSEVKHRLEPFAKPYIKWALTPAVLRQFPDIVEKLESKDYKVRGQVAEELGGKNPEGAVGPLTRLLEDADWWVRYLAADALGKTKNNKAIEPLVNALRDNNREVRFQAQLTLTKVGKHAVEPVTRLLTDENPEVRKGAARVLAFIADKRATETLIAALADKEEEVRYHAAWALGNIREKKAVEPLKKLWKEDGDMKVQVMAAYGLVRAAGDESALCFLIDTLTEKDKEIVGDTAWALGKIGNRKAIEGLIRVLKENDKDTHNSTAWALEKITKQDFGEDYEKWKEWYEKSKEK
jgi:HEAT repeat protein